MVVDTLIVSPETETHEIYTEKIYLFFTSRRHVIQLSLQASYCIGQINNVML